MCISVAQLTQWSMLSTWLSVFNRGGFQSLLILWSSLTSYLSFPFNHLRTIRKYTATLKKMHPLENLLESVQKYSKLKIEIIHDDKEDLSFLLRGRDFLQLIQKRSYDTFFKNCVLSSVITQQGYRTQVLSCSSVEVGKKKKSAKKSAE